MAWKTYDLTITITNQLVGSVPKNPDVVRAWIESRKASEPALARMKQASAPVATLDEIEAEVLATITPEEERSWTGFQSDERGLFIRADNVKAHLKDCANVLRKTLEREPFKLSAARSKLADRVYPLPDRIHLMRDGAPLTEPDGDWERPIHVMTALGPRDALKRSDYVDSPILEIRLKVLDDNVITQPILEEILDYGSIHGIGGERGMGYGRYTWTLEPRD